SYDCRPYKSGNSESCSVASPAAGKYYIKVHGYSSYSGVTVKASYSTGGGGTDHQFLQLPPLQDRQQRELHLQTVDDHHLLHQGAGVQDVLRRDLDGNDEPRVGGFFHLEARQGHGEGKDARVEA